MKLNMNIKYQQSCLPLNDVFGNTSTCLQLIEIGNILNDKVRLMAKESNLL